MSHSHHSKSPSTGRFVVNFNGIEKKIVLKQSKGDYTINRVKTKVFGKFKKLGTTDFYIKLSNGASIRCDGDIISNLLGQNEPFPKCCVFVGIPRFDIDHDTESLSSSDNNDDEYDDEAPISPLTVDQDDVDNNNNKHRRNISNLIELKSIVNQHSIYQGHREYICCFNNVLMQMTLTMFDIAKYSQDWFKNRFLSLFDYKLGHNELLQLRVYHISTKQYIAIKLPLWSYDSQHYHIEGEIDVMDIDIDIDADADDDDSMSNENESISIHDFEDVLNGLQADLKSQQKEFEEMISNINISIKEINYEEEIYLWKKYKFKLKEIERGIASFANNFQIQLNEDLSHHLNTKYLKLKQISDLKLKKLNDLQTEITQNECEIIKMEKAIRRLKFQNHSKQIEMKRDENIWNISQKKLQKLQHFKNKYREIKTQLNECILSFESDQKLKVYDLEKHLNQIWKEFEANYINWTLNDAIHWIISIENFYFSTDTFHPFIETLKTHEFVGKNLKELRTQFTLNVMGLKHIDDQQLLIKNINRIINKKKSRRRSYISSTKSTHTQKQSMATIFDTISSTRSQGNLCCICAENEVNTVVVPCGHMVYCSSCSRKLTITSCPTCRVQDVKIMITYKSGL